MEKVHIRDIIIYHAVPHNYIATMIGLNDAIVISYAHEIDEIVRVTSHQIKTSFKIHIFDPKWNNLCINWFIISEVTEGH